MIEGSQGMTLIGGSDREDAEAGQGKVAKHFVKDPHTCWIQKSQRKERSSLQRLGEIDPKNKERDRPMPQA